MAGTAEKKLVEELDALFFRDFADQKHSVALSYDIAVQTLYYDLLEP